MSDQAANNGQAADEAAVVRPAAASPDEPARRTVREVIAEWEPRLQTILSEWQHSLPGAAEEEWTRGAAYIRESAARSLVGDAPDVQLRNVLGMLAQRKIYIADEALFFDVESGTDIAPRSAFQRLFEQAIAGGFKAVGVFVNERLFRNLEQATQIKREFRLHGIELVYMGMYEGDRRNPAAWHFETMQDAAAELHARNTSYYIGTHFEVISRQGRPVGGIHEVFRQGDRAPSFLGRRGSVLNWSHVEPLASILKEGMKRYLAGASCTDLALWSATTELQGSTPKGRVMDKAWWYNSLTNPTLAGYQKPTEYMGFKPGKESPPRPKLTAESELVPSRLPALWSLDDYREVRRLGKERSHGTKRRRSYRAYLLAGVAFDADCGHRLRVQQSRDDGRYWMACPKHGTEPRHSPGRRADVAERELDELISSLSFEDPSLHAAVEEELRKLAAEQQSAVERFRPDPAIGAARQALAALGRTGMDDVRATLQSRIADLVAADQARREASVQPVVDYRAALRHLREWDAVWKEADTAMKNDLLRQAGVRVIIGPVADTKKPLAHVLALSAENPVFSLALAVALKDRVKTLDQDGSWNRTNVITVIIDPGWMALGSRVGRLQMINGVIPLERPAIAQPRPLHLLPPERPSPGWLTVAEYAARVGQPERTIRAWIHSGRLTVTTAYRGKRLWYFVRDEEADRTAA